jgi:chemotaxis family two-component system sensor kinase Cph1
MKEVTLLAETETNIRKSHGEIAEMSQKDMQDLFSKLQNHQIELKTQNEEMARIHGELQDSKDRYFDLYNFSPAAYLTMNRQGKIIDANLTAASYLNVEMADLIGKKLVSFIADEDRDAYHIHVQSLFEEKGKKPCAIKMQKSDGSIIYTRFESAFVLDASGNETQCAAFLDITCQRTITQNLEKTVEALTKSNTELERFAYVASHDLREPLRNISSCTQLLHMKYNDALDKEGRQLIKYTIDSVQQINALISDLLFYASHGNDNGQFAPVDLEAKLEQVLENLNQLISASKATVTHDSLPNIVADKVQILQLLQNLISNAIKYNDKDNIKVHIGVKLDGDNWLFSVQDNGIGIDEQYFDQIFEIFKRLDSRSKYMGTGIGLAICRRVIDNHGGKLWVESTLGEGSTFYFMLPA